MGTSPWKRAEEAADAAHVTMRPLTTLSDADAILDVMIATWGNHQLLPREMIHALADCGNVPYGAFDEDARLVGYVLGWAAIEPIGGLHVHSHMLATLPERRHAGVGFALKLAQRAQCLDLGIHRVRWTFDPMVARNAWFNLGKLGAMADRFHRDFYGAMADSLNAGERSDRLVVRWDLDPDPGSRNAPPDAERLPIPADYAAVRETDPIEARASRDRVADALEAALDRGWMVWSFEREGSAYVLSSVGGTQP